MAGYGDALKKFMAQKKKTPPLTSPNAGSKDAAKKISSSFKKVL